MKDSRRSTNNRDRYRYRNFLFLPPRYSGTIPALFQHYSRRRQGLPRRGVNGGGAWFNNVCYWGATRALPSIKCAWGTFFGTWIRDAPRIPCTLELYEEITHNWVGLIIGYRPWRFQSVPLGGRGSISTWIVLASRKASRRGRSLALRITPRRFFSLILLRSFTFLRRYLSTTVKIFFVSSQSTTIRKKFNWRARYLLWIFRVWNFLKISHLFVKTSYLGQDRSNLKFKNYS